MMLGLMDAARKEFKREADRGIDATINFRVVPDRAVRSPQTLNPSPYLGHQRAVPPAKTRTGSQENTMKLLLPLMIACAALALAGCDPALKDEPTANAPVGNAGTSPTGKPATTAAPAPEPTTR